MPNIQFDPSTLIVALVTLILNFMYTHIYVKIKVDSHESNLSSIWLKIDDLRKENHEILLTLKEIQTQLKFLTKE